ncbi:hypothetical protein N7462_003367 [Penicillium macrosclerotiorum]|uniref:uncharacterized protein n=1 Tax=Penicillium macrosclerotiorum TaxID=303699 RepID=UPI002546B0E6|nr:uncharacterized protein N7462_003367 [Penicillium macrosclerotiorum]KAJ5688975.1 hypothetical protein N7462_003367 [Penicillium macrosclerotiorum]
MPSPAKPRVGKAHPVSDTKAQELEALSKREKPWACRRAAGYRNEYFGYALHPSRRDMGFGFSSSDGIRLQAPLATQDSAPATSLPFPEGQAPALSVSVHSVTSERRGPGAQRNRETRQEENKTALPGPPSTGDLIRAATSHRRRVAAMASCIQTVWGGSCDCLFIAGVTFFLPRTQSSPLALGRSRSEAGKNEAVANLDTAGAGLGWPGLSPIVAVSLLDLFSPSLFGVFSRSVNAETLILKWAGPGCVGAGGESIRLIGGLREGLVFFF